MCKMKKIILSLIVFVFLVNVILSGVVDVSGSCGTCLAEQTCQSSVCVASNPILDIPYVHDRVFLQDQNAINWTKNVCCEGIDKHTGNCKTDSALRIFNCYDGSNFIETIYVAPYTTPVCSKGGKPYCAGLALKANDGGVSVTKLCNMKGYATGTITKFGGAWSSPADNTLAYWNGSNWKTKAGEGGIDHVDEIRCTNPIPGGTCGTCPTGQTCNSTGQCVSNIIPLIASSVPSQVNKGNIFQIGCDFGNNTLPCIVATHADQGCSWANKWEGTMALFNCTANTVGVQNNTCDLFNYSYDGNNDGINDFPMCIAQQNRIQNITVLPGICDGLIAKYKFEDNAEDNSASGVHDGIISGNVGFSTGKLGKAATFDGDGDYINISDRDSLTTPNQFTWNAWIYINKTNWETYEEWATIFAKDNAWAEEWFSILNNGKITTYFDSRIDNSVGFGGSSSGSIEFNKWQMVTVTWNGTNVKYYINGIYDSSRAYSGVIDNLPSNLIIGQSTPGMYEFKGSIDEVGIWNRELNQDDISALYTKNIRGADYCSATPPCPPNQTIMKLFSGTNSHGALWNFTGYNIDICYDEIFGQTYNFAAGENPHECTGTNKVLGLNFANDSVAEKPELNNYQNKVCYGNLNCTSVANVADCDYNNGKRIILSLAAETNSNISKWNDNNYPVKICCNSPSGVVPLTAAARWEDLNGQVISTAKINSFVNMAVRGSGLQNAEINYTVYKEGINGIWDWLREIFSLGLANTDDVVARTSSGITATFNPNQTGNYYFKAKIQGQTPTYESGNLTVNTGPNLPPSASIVTPVNKQMYFSGTPINFNAIISDSDSPNVTFVWNLGNGETVRGYKSFITGAEANVSFNYAYTRFEELGQKNIQLVVTDFHGNIVGNMTSILIINSSYILAYIDNPPLGFSTNQKLVQFNATSTYAVNSSLHSNGCNRTITCIGGPCPVSTGNCPLCYAATCTSLVVENAPASLSSANYDAITFHWIFDGNPAKFNRTTGKPGTIVDYDFLLFGYHNATLNASVA